jgi:DNA-binding CsgD family transcriptional regulator
MRVSSSSELRQKPQRTNGEVGKNLLPAVVPSQDGLILLDCSLRPIWFNAAALTILSFPEKPTRPELVLTEKIRSGLISNGSSSAHSFSEQFTSGRRKYSCRPFFVNLERPKLTDPFVALLLERNRTLQISHMAEHFKLTQRERQVVELLLNGLTTKELAGRLSISPNTVKALLHLVMAKMGVSTRCGVIGKVVELRAPM